MDDPSAVRKAEPFNGSFPLLGPPTAISGKIHQRCAASLSAVRMILAGYWHNIDEVCVTFFISTNTCKLYQLSCMIKGINTVYGLLDPTLNLSLSVCFSSQYLDGIPHSPGILISIEKLFFYHRLYKTCLTVLIVLNFPIFNGKSVWRF